MRKGHSKSNELEETVPHSLATDDSALPRPLDGLPAEERRTQILQIVRCEGRARVNDLPTTSAVRR
jgi:hypothetical protein